MDAKILEEIWANTQCPICMNHYGDKIFQCSAGHDVCANCRNSCAKCPVCRSEFLGTRNFALEKICKSLLSKLKEQGNKTKDEKQVEFGPKNLKHNLFCGPVQGRGNYKCCVPGCAAALPICRIVNHCRSVHKSIFIEMAKDTCKDDYVHKFSIPAGENTRIYLSPRFGLIFLRFHTAEPSEDSPLIDVWAQIALPQKFTKSIRYELNIENSDGVKVSFSDIPYTTRFTPEEIKKSGHHSGTFDKKGNPLTVYFRIFKNNNVRSHKNAFPSLRMRSTPAESQ